MERLNKKINEDPLLIFHYVNNWLPKGRLSLEEENIEEAEKFRIELIKKLDGLTQEWYVKECKTYLNETKWCNNESMDIFQNKYKLLREKIKK